MNEEENTKQPEITDDSLQPGEIISEEMAMPEKKVTTIELPQTKDMEVHHHAHDPAAPHHKKNWKSYFWEFLMLFLAITLGFLVENQREHYIEHLRAKEFAKSLIKDLESDKLSSDFHQTKSERYIVFVDSLLQVSSKKLEGKNAAAFSFYTRFLYWTEAFSWNRTTFELIKNWGAFAILKIIRC